MPVDWTGSAFPFSRPLKVLVQLLNGWKYFLFCFVFWYFAEFYFFNPPSLRPLFDSLSPS